MSDETTTPAESTETPAEPAEPRAKPRSGVAAAEAVITEHWAKKDAAVKAEPPKTPAATASPTDEEAKKKKKAGLVDELRRERAAGKALKGELAQMRAEIEALKKGGGSPHAAQEPTGKTLSRETWIESLVEAGIDEAEALDALQKRALQNGGIPPAVQKLIDKQAKALEAYKAKLEEVTQGLSSKEEAAAHEAGWRALQTEAGRAEAYPEFEGYDWDTEIAPAAEQAVKYLVGRGAESVTPEEVLGLVHNAFKAQHEKHAERLAKRQPPPPAKKPAPPAAPPKGKAKPQAEDDDLPPVEPSGGRRKPRLPTDKEIQRRIAGQLG